MRAMNQHPGPPPPPPPWPPLLPALGALALAASLAGCAALSPKPTLHLTIQADANTNYGGPLYMVVRKTDRDSFLSEDYDALAGTVLGKADPAILRKEIIWPKDRRELKIEKQKPDDVLGVYFFYSTPGRSWRFAVLDPSVKKMRVRLGTNEIQAVEPGK
jgi:predicted component of type VI protein secretion system